MRVTKAIREYVEEEIYKKYDNAAEKIGKDYFAEKDKVLEGIQKIINSTNEVIINYIKGNGFDYEYRYRTDSILELGGFVRKNDIEQDIRDKRTKLRDEARNKIKEVIFNLEMGETQKAELRQVIDSIIVE